MNCAKLRRKTSILAMVVIFVLGTVHITQTSAYSSPYIGLQVSTGSINILDNYPRKVEIPSGTLTVYEPQIEEHNNFKEATAWSAVYFEPNETREKTYGAIKYYAELNTNFQDRTVIIYNRKVMEVYFPEVENFANSDLELEISNSVRKDHVVIPLDVVLAYLADHDIEARSIQVSFEAPKIVYRSVPTMLVNIDGDPVLVPIAENDDLSVIINTNWDLFHSKKTGNYFLLLGSSWLSSNALDGDWQAANAPEGLENLPDDERWEQVKSAVPGNTMEADEIPQIVVSGEPTELIVSDGVIRYDMIEGTTLSFVQNTSSDIIYDEEDEHYYFLTSGRWFKARALTGPWQGLSSAPEKFNSIPEDHARAHVRASVSGTNEANFATLQAQIPQTAEVARVTEAPLVRYTDDTPSFKKIDGVNVARAENTIYDVLLVGETYYLCYNAIWFKSSHPIGPWQVADTIPAEIYKIPASSPAHNVTYVTVHESTPSTVHFGYTAGYYHSYVSFGVVVYGSGFSFSYNYNPYYYPWYPSYYYYGYPRTYGYSSFYNPVTGAYGHGHYAYGPYGGGYGISERYNPTTGRYTQGAGAWDYNTAYYEGISYNPRNDIGIETAQAFQYGGGNRYDSWGETVISRGNEWASVERRSNELGTIRNIETSRGGEGVQARTNQGGAVAFRTGDGDLYAGANGNVFRKSEQGEWQRRHNGDWSTIDRSELQATAQSRVQNITPEQRASVQSRVQAVTPAQRQSIQNRAQQMGPQLPSSLSNRQSTLSRSSTSQYDRLNSAQRARINGNQRYQTFKNYRGRVGTRSRGGGRLRRN